VDHMNWIQIALLATAAIAVFLAWAFIRITKRAQDAARSLLAVETKDIPLLVEECIRVSREKLGVSLDLEDLEGSAENLDYLLEPRQRSRMKMAFAIDRHPGRFALPLGACLGELVRRHVPSCQWIPRQGGGLAMEIPHPSSTITMHPFDKVLKHAATGQTGEFKAYIYTAVGKLPVVGP
jgi:hypothetical protein